MTYYISSALQNAQSNILLAWSQFQQFTTPALSNFDPSLLQNVVLGILAIFIPYGIVFLTSAVDKDQPSADFSRLVINDEVFELKRLFIVTIVSISVLSFFSGTTVSTGGKIFTIIFASLVLYQLQKSYWKMVRYSENKRSFDLIYLKKLRLKANDFNNNEKVYKAWEGVLSCKIKENENSYVKIFNNTIDRAISDKLEYETVQLFEIFIKNMSFRYMFLVGNEVFPKILEWNKIFHSRQEEEISGYKKEKEQTKLQKKFYGLFPRQKKHFWNWHYFYHQAFKTIVPGLLKSGESFQLFDSLKKHTEVEVENWGKEPVKEVKEKQYRYIHSLFVSFCEVYFETVADAPDSYTIWEHYFPGEWKISPTNYENLISRIFAEQFTRWSQDKIFRNNGEKHTRNLSGVIENLFVNTNSSTFSSFLRLFYFIDVKTSVEVEKNFIIVSSLIFDYSGESISDEQREKMWQRQQEEAQQNTLKIIVKYFNYWHLLRPNKDDLTEEEFKKWDSLEDKIKLERVQEIRLKKIESTISQLESFNFNREAKEDKLKEHTRQEMLGFLELLKNKIRE